MMTQVWEQQKILLLNNPKVISAVLQKLKFPKENFESWLNLHNINASRAFGTKITFEKMKQADRKGIFDYMIIYLVVY